MMRDISLARKLILLVALLSVIGMAFGCLADDMLSAGGSFADDPAFPVPTGGIALAVPARPALVPALMLASSAISAAGAAHTKFPGLSLSASPHAMPAGFTLPQRC